MPGSGDWVEDAAGVPLGSQPQRGEISQPALFTPEFPAMGYLTYSNMQCRLNQQAGEAKPGVPGREEAAPREGSRCEPWEGMGLWAAPQPPGLGPSLFDGYSDISFPPRAPNGSHPNPTPTGTQGHGKDGGGSTPVLSQHEGQPSLHPDALAVAPGLPPLGEEGWEPEPQGWTHPGRTRLCSSHAGGREAAGP